MKIRVNVKKACGALFEIDGGKWLNFEYLDLNSGNDINSCKYLFDDSGVERDCKNGEIDKCSKIYKEIKMSKTLMKEFLYRYIKDESE
jgi:hypothetical protein